MKTSRPTDIRSNACTMPYLSREMLEDFLDGEFKLYWHDQLLLRPLTTRERMVFDEAVKNGYIVAGRTMKFAAGAYFHWCEVNCRPNIEVRPKHKYARIEADFISIVGSEGYSASATKKIRDLILSVYIGDLRPKSSLNLGGIYSYFEIKKEIATKLAKDLYDIAIDDMKLQYGNLSDVEALKDRISKAHTNRPFGSDKFLET